MTDETTQPGMMSVASPWEQIHDLGVDYCTKYHECGAIEDKLKSLIAQCMDDVGIDPRDWMVEPSVVDGHIGMAIIARHQHMGHYYEIYHVQPGKAVQELIRRIQFDEHVINIKSGGNDAQKPQ